MKTLTSQVLELTEKMDNDIQKFDRNAHALWRRTPRSDDPKDRRQEAIETEKEAPSAQAAKQMAVIDS